MIGPRVATVRLFLDFAEDRRESMENYAAELRGALVEAGCPHRVDTLRPRYPRIPCLGRAWNDRYARYVAYPRQARGRDGDANHVIDHGYAHLLGTLRPERTVVTVHDLIPLAAARGRIVGGRRARPWLSEFSAGHLRRAGALVADSESTRRDLIEMLEVEPARVRVVAPGVSPRFRPLQAPRNELRARLGLPPDAALVLATGTQFYKNHATSVRVLSRLAQRAVALPPVLVCLGRLSADARDEVARRSLGARVMELPALQNQALVELYNAVDCLLFPSLHEGFGWPPLEAMASGTPVVCSDAGSLPEVVGEAALMAPPLDDAALAGAVERVLADEATRSQLRQKGFARAARYRWSDHARALLGVYEELLRA